MIILVSSVIFSLAACDPETKKSDSTPSKGTLKPEFAAGEAEVVDLENGAAKIDFSASAVGAQYIMQPFHTGTLGSTEGAGASVSAYTVNMNGHTYPKSSLRASLTLDFSEPDPSIETSRLYKMILNRFAADDSYTRQSDGLWSLVARYDQMTASSNLLANGNDAPLRSELLGRIQQYEAAKRKQSGARSGYVKGAQLAATACPTIGTAVQVGAASSDDVDDVTDVEAGDGYCVLYFHDTLSSHLSKAKIKTTVESIIAAFKTTIYNDSFAAKDGQTYTPYFYVGDMSLFAQSRRDSSGSFGSLLGVYDKDLSHALKYPVVFVSGLQTSKDNAKGAREILSTFGHELQHATLEYLKGKNDVLYFDEAYAQFIEDAFGFRDDGVLESFVTPFLFNRASGSYPFLSTSAFDKDDNSKSRGAAQSFLSYLIGQVGGLTYTNGKLASSSGLTLFASAVKSSDIGMKNLYTVFSGIKSGISLNQSVGNYLSALFLDNSTISGVPSTFTMQTEITGVTDVSGATDKTYGIRFNGGTLEQALSQTSELTATSIELHEYETRPIYFQVTDTSKAITIESAADGASISLLRVK